MKHSLLLISLIWFSNTLSALHIDTLSIASAHLGEERKVAVWLPDDYDSTQHYNVVYVLDADWMFDLTWPVVNYYSAPWVGGQPRSIVVGVYSDERNEDMDIDWENGRLRSRGEQFKSYIADEVVPEVERRYNCATFKTIVGHSNSSTFLNFFLWQDDPLFNGYVALSQFYMEGDPTRFEQAFQTNKPIYYYVVSASGDAEYRLGTMAKYDSLMAVITLPENVHYESLTLTRANHQTLAAQGLPHALSFIYQRFKHLNDFESAALDSIEKHKLSAIAFVNEYLSELSRHYDTEVNWNEADCFFAYAAAEQTKDTAEIHLITQYYLSLHPQQKEMYFIEGQVFETVGANAAAEKSYLKNLAENEGAAFWSYYRLARLYAAKLNDPEKAFQIAQRAWTVLNDPYFLYYQGRLSAKYTIHPDAGKAALQKSLTLEQTEHTYQLSWCHYYLAQLHQQGGQIKSAKRELQRALDLDPAFEEALLLLEKL